LALPLQRNFYGRYVRGNKDRTVVIISDAMRYEVGRELLLQLQDDPKCTAKMEPMLSTLPSYTRLGMAALLPHKILELTPDGKELADGVYCMDIPTRQSVLQAAQPDSCCVQFDEIKNMKKAALRECSRASRSCISTTTRSTRAAKIPRTRSLSPARKRLPRSPS
jgi:hypothetical protein